MSTCAMRFRCAATAFSFSPPIGSTRPRNVISPVIATSPRTGNAGERAHDRRGDRDARGWAVLRRRAGGNVHVQIAIPMELAIDA